MRLSLILLLFLLIPFKTFSQKNILDTTKTRIPGTKFLIDKPTLFEIADNFNGLKGKNADIVFSDIPGANYFSFQKDFLELISKVKEVSVLDYQAPMTLNGYSATFLLYQLNDKKSITLIFGDKDRTFLIEAVFAHSTPEILEEVKTALLTVEYKKELPLDSSKGDMANTFPYEKARFTIDDTDSSYKFLSLYNNSFNYSKHGKPIDLFKNRDYQYVITQVPLNADEIDNPRMLLSAVYPPDVFEYFGLKTTEEFVSERTSLNGYKCYEEIIIGNLNGVVTKRSLLSVVHEKQGIVIFYYAPLEDEETLSDFELMTASLQIISP